MQNNRTSILITGDLVVSQTYNSKEKIDQSLIDLFAQSDINIVNLEAPVTDSENKILKTGPSIKSHQESTANVLETLQIDVAVLANNHVLDYDEKGVEDTLEFCKQQDVKTVGAGMNLKEASKSLYLDTDKGKIAIVNFAENEWASATDTLAGANPMDIIDNATQIKDARQNADYVIVIIHGGHEYYNLPSTRMQKQYRFYADQGADIVVAHHTHCISGNEIWKGVPIFYSLGNFLFTKKNIHEDWYTGLVLEVQIDHEGKLRTKLHPVKQDQQNYQLQLLLGVELQEVNERIEKYNNIINIGLDEHWDNYVNSKSKIILNYWSPLAYVKNKYLKIVLNKLNLNFINKKGISLYLNLMRCEAHSDLSKKVLRKYLKK